MRKLKQSEIDAAPGWATDYVTQDIAVRYSNETHYQWFNAPGTGRKARMSGKSALITQPIPRKEFDIDEYDFSDTTICIANIGEEIIILQGEVHYDIVAESYVSLNKLDAIALAKHFKLTASDLL